MMSMRSHIAAALFLAPGLAGAAETDLDSRIDRVTVYPDGAVVTRLGKASLLQGVSQIVLRGLPATIDPASIRVEGRSVTEGPGSGAFSVGAVDVRVMPGEAKPVLDRTVADKLKALRDEKGQHEGRIAAIEAQRATIERFAQVGPDKLGPDGKALPVSDWPAVFEAIGTALVKVQNELRGERTKLADVEAEIAALERARPQATRPGAPKRDIAIAVEAPQAVAAEFTVSYRVGGAQWIPGYEARLTTTAEKPELTLTRRAEIRQRTGEDWSDVALTLSTTRSAGGAGAPELQPMQVSFFEPPPVYETRRRMEAMPAPAPLAAGKAQADARAEAEALASARAVRARPADIQRATVEAGPYQASFQVPGRATVAPDGTAKTVMLTERKAEPSLSARAVPELEQKAFLEARFSHDEEAPLLPGKVSLHRDGTYVGTGRIGLVAPGDEVALGFGADDRIKVSYAPVKRRENEPRWLNQSRTDQREFRTVVKSLHAQPVRITVLERIPFSENSAITVETLTAQTTSPTEKQVGDKRGVSSWTFDLPPGGEKEIRLAYRIKWPGDREVSYEEQPLPQATD
jgi:uncharacterized protein (TIGR02231 family)